MSPKNLAIVVLSMLSLWVLVRLCLFASAGIFQGAPTGLPFGATYWIGRLWTGVAKYVVLILPIGCAAMLYRKRRTVARAISGPTGETSGPIASGALRRAALALFGIYLVLSAVEAFGGSFWLDNRFWIQPVDEEAIKTLVAPSVQMLLGLLLLVFCPLIGMMLRQEGEAEEDLV